MTSDRKLYRWFYDNIHSRYYNALLRWCFFPLGGEAHVRRELLGKIEFRTEDLVLDMCCGAGNATFALAEKLGAQNNIVGADLSLGQVRVAKKHNRFQNIEFMVADATAGCFRDGTFDKVIIPHAIHEMPRATRMKVLGEARRILKDEGTLAVLEMDNPPTLAVRLFIGFWWFYWLPFNFETPTRRDMLRHGLTLEIEEAGFTNVYKSSFHRGILQVVQGTKPTK